MNWFALIAQILQAAPSELALIKGIVDMAHGTAGSPTIPAPPVVAGAEGVPPQAK